MKHAIPYALLLVLLTCAAISQTDTPPGEDPVPREGQPLRCNNFFSNKHKCECNRAKECPTDEERQHGQDPNSKCQTWCRKSKCGCLHPCTSGVHKPMGEEGRGGE